MRAEDIAVAIVSEPYIVGRAELQTDLLGRASVGVFPNRLMLSDVKIGFGYVTVTVGSKVSIHICYVSTALSVDEFSSS